MNDRHKRILYKSCRRGMKETDLILGAFADRHLASLTKNELDQFESLLACTDQQIYQWVLGREAVPDRYNNKIMDILTKLEIKSENK